MAILSAWLLSGAVKLYFKSYVLIRHKWNTFGRYAFYFNLMYYVLFVGVFTEYMQVGHDLNLILNLGITFSIAKSPSLQPRTASRPGHQSQVSDPKL